MHKEPQRFRGSFLMTMKLRAPKLRLSLPSRQITWKFIAGFALLLLAISLATAAHAQEVDDLTCAGYPVITSITNTTTPRPGQTITINGSGFGPSDAVKWISINGAYTLATAWSDTSITAIIPMAATANGTVIVTVADGLATSNAVPFAVAPWQGAAPPTPQISAVSPSYAVPGQLVTVTGSGFGQSGAIGWDSFAILTPLTWSDSTITFLAPPLTDAFNYGYLIGIEANGVDSTSVNTYFQILPPLQIYAITPASAAIGTAVAITVNEAFDTVMFNGVPATPTLGVNSMGQLALTVTVPPGATTGSVIGKVGLASSNSYPFTVLPSPNNLTVTASLVSSSLQYGGDTTVTVQASCNTSCGSIELFVDGQPGVTASLDSNGTKSLDVAAQTLHGGTHVIQVKYLGSATYNPATSSFISLTITKITPVVTWTPTQTIAFGTQLANAQLNATATVPGTFAYNPGLGIALPPGSHGLSVVFTPTDTTDYNTANATSLLTVTPPPGVPYISNLSLNRQSSGATLTITGFTFGAAGTGGTVLLNGVNVPTTSWSSTSITLALPTHIHILTVSVHTSAGLSNILRLTITPPICQIFPPPLLFMHKSAESYSG